MCSLSLQNNNKPAQLWVTSLLPEELFATIDKIWKNKKMGLYQRS